jgi:tRNA pseudouridine38-40 synthase
MASAEKPSSIRGAGRTDAGVHALGQVAHVDLDKPWPDDTVRDAINAHLQMACERIVDPCREQVSDDFDARFSALRRHYLYRIICRRAPLVIEKNRALVVAPAARWRPCTRPRNVWSAGMISRPFDQCSARPIHRCVRSTDLMCAPARPMDLIEIHATAQSFLHNQIRSFAGTLRLVGEGKWNADDVEAALAARSRKACGPVAAPEGLYFLKVDYPG